MKKEYLQPKFSVHILLIEEGIANSSASFETGDVGNEPTVEDWVEKPSTDRPSWDFDF